MKPLLISTSDSKGGAARSSYRLHQGLIRTGVASQMLVCNKVSDDSTVISQKNKLQKVLLRFLPTLDSFPLQLYPHQQHTPYSTQWFPSRIIQKVNQLAPDIINLHWICQGYVSIEAIASFGKPIVWTLHDMWPFTGGCHYAQECKRYTESCGYCPQLSSNQDYDLSRWIWSRKAKAWKNLNITIVTPSKWLANCANSSSLFQELPVQVIPYGIDTKIYKPIDRGLARKILGLPLDKYLILFGSVNATSSRRKGFHLLLEALQKLSNNEKIEEIELVVFGASQPRNQDNFGFKVHYQGKLNDEISLSLLYAASDVFVAPSLEDNLPNTVMEALACGTPCVAFNIGGIPDMIVHQQNGYLAKPYVVEDFAQGISWVLKDDERQAKLSYFARHKVEQEFTLEIQAKQYISLFQTIIGD